MAVLTNEQHTAAIQQAVSDVTANPSALPQTVLDWLSGLGLFYGVPFIHLVPDTNMLPNESLRFFFVDRNWINALVDGAVSVSVQTSKDLTFQQNTAPYIRQQVYAEMPNVRAKAAGQTPAASGVTESDFLATGVLIRSQIVTGWPGLKVFGYDESGNPLPLIRMDRLTSSVMLCLFLGEAKKITLQQPKQGLVFGVQDGNVIALKYLANVDTDKQVGNSVLSGGSSVTVDAAFRDSGTGVLDLTQTNQNLEAQKTTMGLDASAAFGTADFAIEMVSLPEEQDFVNSGTG